MFLHDNVEIVELKEYIPSQRKLCLKKIDSCTFFFTKYLVNFSHQRVTSSIFQKTKTIHQFDLNTRIITKIIFVFFFTGEFLYVIFELVIGLITFATVLGFIANIVTNVSAARKDFQGKSWRGSNILYTIFGRNIFAHFSYY